MRPRPCAGVCVVISWQKDIEEESPAQDLEAFRNITTRFTYLHQLL